MIEFAHPILFLLAIPVLVGLWLRMRNRGSQAAVRFSSLRLLADTEVGVRVRLHRLLPLLSGIAMLLLVVALAQPRIAHTTEEIEGEGIDIMISLDISGSMRALDFAPLDRLSAAKEVINGFIAERPFDKIGLVLFAAKSFTQCPLTLDHPVLLRFLDEVEVGLIDDGTAIGLGLATAVNRLRRSTADSKTIILLTDGLNNVPTLEPETRRHLVMILVSTVHGL